MVPPGAGWTRDPYGAEIVDGWMVGRGVAVSKSDIATYAFAHAGARSTRRGAERDGRDCTSLTTRRPAARSARAVILEQGFAARLAIGAGFSYAVVSAHNGCLHLEVEILGRSAHAARPFTGVDALEAASGVLAALYRWHGGLRGAAPRRLPASARRS